MAGNGDMQAHEGTYGGFLTMLKVGTIITVIVSAVVIIAIAS
jgi:Bacterial aa3 type cytochrome c oxidase subunit IV